MDVQGRHARVVDDRPVVVHDDVPDVLLVTPPDRPVVIPDPPRPRLRRAVLGGVLAGLVLAAAIGGWVATRGDDSVGTAPSGQTAKPAPPAALSFQVSAPTTVKVGKRAHLEITWADGQGIFSGATEEWGDGVGTSSLKEARCEGAPAATAVNGTFRTAHSWLKPGTYQVVVGVSSYTCVDGVPVEEQATQTVPIEVVAR